MITTVVIEIQSKVKPITSKQRKQGDLFKVREELVVACATTDPCAQPCTRFSIRRDRQTLPFQERNNQATNEP